MGATMNKAFVFDFDDTLAVTDSKVLVKNQEDHTTVMSLTPSQYNKHELETGKYYDYGDFRRGDKISGARATSLIELAKQVHDEEHDVYILTARSDACADAIKKFLSLHNITAKTIFCVGDVDTSAEKTIGQVGNAKSAILSEILQDYDKVYFYDDHQGNIDSCPDSPKMRKYKV